MPVGTSPASMSWRRHLRNPPMILREINRKAFSGTPMGASSQFDPPQVISTSPMEVFPPEAQPVGINDFDDIAGNYPFFARPAVFTRSAAGVYDAGISVADRGYLRRLLSIGAGSVVGFTFGGVGPYTGFVLAPGRLYGIF